MFHDLMCFSLFLRISLHHFFLKILFLKGSSSPYSPVFDLDGQTAASEAPTLIPSDEVPWPPEEKSFVVDGELQLGENRLSEGRQQSYDEDMKLNPAGIFAMSQPSKFDRLVPHSASYASQIVPTLDSSPETSGGSRQPSSDSDWDLQVDRIIYFCLRALCCCMLYSEFSSCWFAASVFRCV